VINTSSKGQGAVMKTLENKQEVQDIKWKKLDLRDAKKWSSMII
jgi:hypothetical protein